MTKTLTPDGRPLKLDETGFVIVSKGVTARVEDLPGSVTGARSGAAGFSRAVLQSADVREMGTIILQELHPEREDAKRVSLYVPGGGKEDGRLVLYFDEDGGVSFHLPQEEKRPPTGVRAGTQKTLRFDVPIRSPQRGATKGATTRGVGGLIAKKVLKVIGWKLAGIAAKKVGPALVRRWEAAHRPLQLLNAETLFNPQPAPMETPIPPDSVGQRSLLFIHGTFSRVATAFDALAQDEAFMAQIRQRYGERIYGFNHATVGTGVASNAMQFLERLSPGQHTFDIICHSRGGLVARALRDLNEAQLRARFTVDAARGNYADDLLEWGKAWRFPPGVELRVERILFAATPNNGTILAQPLHLKKYLEILMTASNILPDFLDVSVDAILSVAKLLLAELAPALPGLDDQKPDSSLLPLLQDAPAPQDAAVQADYAAPPGLNPIMRLEEAGMDFIFGDKKNDLVVPTEGVSRWRGGAFNPERVLAWQPEDSVHHSNLFRQASTRQELLAWLV